MSVQSMAKLFVQKLSRRKCIDFTTSERHTLARVLSTFDLTALGIASTLGSGTYVIAGQVARSPAGPAVILSFVVAGIASVFAGLCYSEFGARVPRAGSAYIYSYVTVGELWAFAIGWNLILEYVIGTAAIARAFTPYIDSLCDSKLSNFFLEYAPLHVTTFSKYADLLALGITLILTVILCFGVKESSLLNNIFTFINLFVVAYVMIIGLFKADLHNWNIPKSEIPPDVENAGNGGFFPFGVSGMLAGSATCFYAFVGFDVIATTGEEVMDPQKGIPIAIIMSLFIGAVCYIGLAGVLTLMVPYYSLDALAPLPDAFSAVGWKVANYIIAVGALSSFGTCLLTTMFPMPRIIFAMSRDGLLFRFLARINQRFLTPIYATAISGILAGIMATLFDLSELVAMMSIGTLLAYTLVAACVLILRYDYSPGGYASIQVEDPSNACSICCPPRDSLPTHTSSMLVKIYVFLIGVMTVALGLLEIFLIDKISHGVWWAILLIVMPIVILIVLIILISRQPQQPSTLTFQVPFVPLLPTLSIMMNIYLMLKLSKNTWIRFGIWMAIGLLIYFGYGMHHAGEQTFNSSQITTDPVPERTEDEENDEEKPLLSKA